jgi:prepilin-type N-terminal cleavage/methylation domain-containing protein/prepilin-type processing-associated H-X9-DG protein
MRDAVVCRRGGFSLLELLTVIAVVALLAGLFAPTLIQARERARGTSCLARLHQMTRAHSLYLQDWDDRFPPWRQLVPKAPPTPDDEETDVAGRRRRQPCWPELLRPYLGSASLLRDPSALPMDLAEGEERLADYALTAWGCGGTGTNADPYFHWVEPALTTAQVLRPSETILLGDGLTTTQRTWITAARHGAGINAAFLDGHTRWLSTADFWRVNTDGHGFYWYHHGTVDR